MKLFFFPRTPFGFSVVVTALPACSAFHDNCPHQVVDRAATVEVAPADACSLYRQLSYAPPPGSPGFGFGSSPRYSSICPHYCNDSSINFCFLPNDYLDAFGPLLLDASDAGLTCPAPPDGKATVTVTCEVTHTEGTQVNGCPKA